MYLYGAGGHAKVIIDIIEAMGLPLEGLIDDSPDIFRVFGYPVDNLVPEHAQLLISIGDNKTRYTLSRRYAGHPFVTAIHPSAIISPHSWVGVGSVVMQGAIIQANAQVGNHAIVNTGASIDHDCNISDFVHIAPHSTLCANVSVGEGTWIGAGTTVIPGIKIGRWSYIGAGSVITKDIPDFTLAYGNPCRIIKDLPHHE